MGVGSLISGPLWGSFYKGAVLCVGPEEGLYFRELLVSQSLPE